MSRFWPTFKKSGVETKDLCHRHFGALEMDKVELSEFYFIGAGQLPLIKK
jgi:hypothetical protein